jgi:hypothetical protein
MDRDLTAASMRHAGLVAALRELCDTATPAPPMPHPISGYDDGWDNSDAALRDAIRSILDAHEQRKEAT